MVFRTFAVLALAAMIAASAAHATTIVNLNADPTKGTVNAGRNSGSYNYNPKTLTLGPGTYNVNLSSIAAGGAFDAYSVATPAAGNYTDLNWSVSLNGMTAAYTQANLGRFSTAAQANAVYSTTPGYNFTLASTQQVSFYLDDTAGWNFGDDTGGVSLAVNPVPEPATVGLFLLGATGAVAARRYRNKAAHARPA